MKTHIQRLVAMAAVMAITSTQAQMGGGMGGGSPGPQISAAMAKLFGENKAFSADIEMNINMPGRGEAMVLPGKFAFDDGKSRFDFNLTDAKGAGIPPEAREQVKSMGMDRMVIMSRPDKKVSYMIYPNLQAYAQQPVPASGSARESEFKIETTELGKETVDGHPCVKNKVVVTDDKGEKHESTLWNATDLKNFPIKIETTEQGTKMTLSFKNVKLAKPAASQFEPPSSYKKHDNFMALMQEEMMKRMGGGAGMDPGQ